MTESRPELPRSIEPSRDLWPEIEARIREISPVKGHIEPASLRASPPDDATAVADAAFGEPASRTDRARPRWGWTIGLAAAAGVAGLVAGAWLVDVPSGGTAGGAGGVEGPGSAVVGDAGPASFVSAEAQVRAVEAAYEPDIRELRSLLESSDLAPETREVLEASLTTIDRAIDEARAALVADPEAVRAMEGLQRMYDAKVDLLRFAATHT